MLKISKTLIDHRELIWALAWKNIVVRYKQAYLGLAWAVLRPVMLMLIFMLVRAFVEIDSGGIPYPILTFAALMPWMLFQDATSEGVSSIVQNASLIKKIYFPREVFPLTAVFTKLIEFAITVGILAGLMVYYKMPPTIHVLWVPLIVLYVTLVSSLVWEMYGTDWVELDAPRHLYLHSLKSIELTGQRAGLRLETTTFDSTAFEFYGSEQYRRGIALFADNSFGRNPSLSDFTYREMAQFFTLAEQANRERRGGRGCFLFRAA